MIKHSKLAPKWKPKFIVTLGMLGIVLLAGMLLFLSLPGRSLAAPRAEEPPSTDPHQGNTTYREHLAVIAADAELQRTWECWKRWRARMGRSIRTPAARSTHRSTPACSILSCPAPNPAG